MAAARVVPSALKVSAITHGPKPLSVRRRFPLCVPQSLTVPSALAEANISPSGLNATLSDLRGVAIMGAYEFPPRHSPELEGSLSGAGDQQGAIGAKGEIGNRRRLAAERMDQLLHVGQPRALPFCQHWRRPEQYRWS